MPEPAEAPSSDDDQNEPGVYATSSSDDEGDEQASEVVQKLEEEVCRLHDQVQHSQQEHNPKYQGFTANVCVRVGHSDRLVLQHCLRPPAAVFV